MRRLGKLSREEGNVYRVGAQWLGGVVPLLPPKSGITPFLNQCRLFDAFLLLDLGFETGRCLALPQFTSFSP